MESLPEQKNRLDTIEVERYGCCAVFVDGLSMPGEPGIPNSDLMSRIDTMNERVIQRYQLAVPVIRSFATNANPDNVWTFVVRSRIQYVGAFLTNPEQLAIDLPKSANIFEETKGHAMVKVPYEGPLFRVNKERTREGLTEFLVTLTQAASAMIKKYGGTENVSLQLMITPSKTKGALLIAMIQS
jgi:hypothetical protein